MFLSEKSKTRTLLYAAVLLALSVAVPQMFHMTGVPAPGQIFLPMHIPVLLAGFLLGPLWGGAIGLSAPVMNCLLMGMPSPARLPFMMIELLTYGVASGLLYRTFRLGRWLWGVFPSLVGAMLAGRVTYAIGLLVATELLGIPCGGVFAAWTATVTGLPGIGIQIVLIPVCVLSLQKARLIDRVQPKST